MKKIISTLIALVIVIAAIAAIGFVLTKNKEENEAKTAIVAQGNAAVAVQTAKVTRQNLDISFSANGYFAPYQELSFSAEKAGRVVEVFVKEGSYVKAGQVLATVRTEQLSVDLENARANYRNALREKERYESAFKTGGVTQQQVEQAKLNLQNAAAKVEQAKISIGDANIRSSINGVVNKRLVEPGSVLSVGTDMFELVNVSRLKLEVAVNEQQVVTLKKGDKVTVTASVFPDKKFSGVISFIAPKADNSLSFPVEIEVANNNTAALKAGMYGTAAFELPQQAPAVLIPRSAFTGSVSSNKVFVLENGQTARLRKVVAGRILGDQVEVLSGLEEGDTIITSGQVNLVNGSMVTPVK